MNRFIEGFIVGIIVCTVGFSGIGRMFDNGVGKIQSIAKTAASK